MAFFIALARPPDGTHVKIVFSAKPVAIEALNPANYAIGNGEPLPYELPFQLGIGDGGSGSSLNIRGVVQETDLTFILVTDPQDPGVDYTLTASNIHDINGNPI